MILGIHHVTAVCSDAQKNVDFYAGTLGLRLVKATVNFDDPGSFHLYYGDATGAPGSIMTFFAWPGGYRGRTGPGQATATAFAVASNALHYWRTRLQDAGVAIDDTTERFGERVLRVADPDGLVIEIIGTGDIADETAIKRFHSVTLEEAAEQPTRGILVDTMNLTVAGTEDNRTRYAASGGGASKWIDIVTRPDAPRARPGTGVVHHVAYRVADDKTEVEWQSKLTAAGLNVSPVMERNYFRSIYYREPGGVLFEIATDGPGFAVDESADTLGTRLMLPENVEPHRAAIAANLPKITLPGGAVLP